MLRHGTCLAARRRLGDLCDGDLAPPDERRIRRHLDGCRRCSRALSSLRATIADLGSLGAQPVPGLASQHDRIVERIARGASDTSDSGTGDQA